MFKVYEENILVVEIDKASRLVEFLFDVYGIDAKMSSAIMTQVLEEGKSLLSTKDNILLTICD